MTLGIIGRNEPATVAVYHYEKPTIEELRERLHIWCQEKEGTLEYEARLETTTCIIDCYRFQLEKLDLSRRNLTSLPEEIGALESLTYLDLRNNRLTALPASLSELTHLNQLILDNNPMESVPISLCYIANHCSISTEGCRLDRSILEWGDPNRNTHASRLATSTTASRLATHEEICVEWELDFNER